MGHIDCSMSVICTIHDKIVQIVFFSILSAGESPGGRYAEDENSLMSDEL